MQTLNPSPRKLRIDLSTLDAFVNHQLSDEIDRQVFNYLATNGKLVNRLPQPLREQVYKKLHCDEEQSLASSPSEAECSSAKFRVRSRTFTSHRTHQGTKLAIDESPTDDRPPATQLDSFIGNKESALLSGNSETICTADPFSILAAPRSLREKSPRKGTSFAKLFGQVLAHAVPPIVTIAFGYYWLGAHFSESGHSGTIDVEMIPDGWDVYVDDKQLRVDRETEKTVSSESVTPGNHVVKVIRRNGTIFTRPVNIAKNENLTISLNR